MQADGAVVSVTSMTPDVGFHLRLLLVIRIDLLFA